MGCFACKSTICLHSFALQNRRFCTQPCTAYGLQNLRFCTQLRSACKSSICSKSYAFVTRRFACSASLSSRTTFGSKPLTKPMHSLRLCNGCAPAVPGVGFVRQVAKYIAVLSTPVRRTCLLSEAEQAARRVCKRQKVLGFS